MRSVSNLPPIITITTTTINNNDYPSAEPGARHRNGSNNIKISINTASFACGQLVL